MQLTRRHFRSMSPTGFTFSAQGDASARRIGTVAGYALRWNQTSSDRGGYVVRLRPGSARFATPTLGLYSHNVAQLLASTANRTLRLTPDSVGVRFELDLPDTTLGRDVAELVRLGTLNGMSFAMTGDPDGQVTNERGVAVMDVSSFMLDEVSLVASPAFPGTSVAHKRTAEDRQHATQLQRERFDRVRLAMLRLPPQL